MEDNIKQGESIPAVKDYRVETYPVIDADIVGTTMSNALELMIDNANVAKGGYACFANAHVCVMTHQESSVKSAVADATYAFPDGTPVYWVGKYLHGRDIEKISGPDFMGKMFESERGRKLRHYLYGGKPEVLEKLVVSLRERYCGCNIVGAVSPPFRELSDKEKTDELQAIRDSGAQIVWVGLGAPKQELWMQKSTIELPNAMLMGVGAAFDFHSGEIARAPEWIQIIGMEWLHRLLQEPKRLWKRYLITNSLFIFLSLREWVVGVLRRK